MQISQLVTVRRRRWRITAIRPYEDCQLVTLTGSSASDAGVERQVLAPFDTIEPIERSSSLRRVRAAVWRRAARALLASDAPPGSLRTVHQAGIEVMPHQLEPALAVLRGLGCRVLLADEVGLGKTIQAAIVIAELRARGAADRVLVLTPAGLREQWTQELSARFGIDAQAADAMTMRRRATEMPVGLNPWSLERVAVASIDYVKRPEVLPAVTADPWDVVVVDEAHAAAGDSDRRAAVGALASRAAFVLLLTATPHSGDRQSFVSLTRIGALDAHDSLDPIAAPDNFPLLVFRRRRSDVRGGARRRVHVLRVTPTAAATEMHALLSTYTRALLTEHEAAWLPASVLHKRAFSSAWSLAQSVERRLETLMRAEALQSAGNGGQLALPLGDPDGEQTKADEPPSWPTDLSLADPLRETRLLRELLAAARRAARTESKLNAIRRILRRVRQPAIVFTEYRDTLRHLQQVLRCPAAVLHGGLTRDERAAALRDFSAGRHTLLLATDAAGEGLNLHHACRTVINLELPWNPMRLEQRIGRVDRIGQQRVVHAWHLVADSVGEAGILDRLKARIERARADLGAPDPFGDDEERAIARAVVSGPGPENGQLPTPRGESFDPLALNAPQGDRIAAPDLRDDAACETRRLAFSRSLAETRHGEVPTSLSHPARAVASLEAEGAWVCRARGSATRAALGQRLLLLYRLAFEDGCGRIVESSCVSVAVRVASEDGVRVPCLSDRFSRASLRRLLTSIEPDVCRLIETATAPWRAEVERINGAFTSTRLRRERAIEAALETTAPDAFQPGLFDRRAERRHFDAIVDRQRIERELASRVDRVVAASALRPAPTFPGSSPTAPRLLLVLVP